MSTAFNQGLQNAARNHGMEKPDVFATNAEAEAWARQQEAVKGAASEIKPYQEPPPLEVSYIETTAQTPAPYASDAEAWKDLGSGLVKLGVVAVGVTAIAGGAVWVWNALTVTAAVAPAPVAVATGVSWATIAWGLFALIAIVSLFSGRGSSEPKRSNAVPMGGNTAQNINVVVNVAGNSVTTTTNGK